MLKHIFIFFISIFLLVKFSVSQNCHENIHSLYCKAPKDLMYTDYGMSRTIPVFNKGPQRIVIPFYGRKNYYISLATQDNTNQKIRFRIISKEFNQVIFDNKKHKYKTDFEFTAITPIKLVIEIRILEKRSLESYSDFTCVGLALFQKKNK